MSEYLFPWLSDVDRAAQYLTSLTLSTSAQATMIIQAEQLWAYAGELSQPAIHELLDAVVKTLSDGGSKDFAKFIALESTSSEYLLYATHLGGNVVLVLAFDVKVPFSKIRSQVNRLASALKAFPEEGPAEHENWLEEAEPSQILLEPLFPLDDVPPPTPTLSTKYQTRLDEEEYSQGHVTTVPPQTGNEYVEIPQSSQFDHENEPTWELDIQAATPAKLPDFDHTDDIIANIASIEEDILTESRSSLERDFDLELPKFKVVTPQFNISYVFLLVPRLPTHLLDGELATELDRDMHQLSMAFGWRLEQMFIQHDHIQWIAKVPPNTSPSGLIHLIREHTSKRLFSRFVHLRRENPSGDFWAPGYLVLSSSRPLSEQIIKSFVQQTRINQGASA